MRPRTGPFHLFHGPIALLPRAVRMVSQEDGRLGVGCEVELGRFVEEACKAAAALG